MKDHIIRNMCSNFGKYIYKLENWPVNLANWSMFMNSCMWAAFYLGEEGENSREVMNHQIHQNTDILCEPDLNASQKSVAATNRTVIENRSSCVL